MDSLHYEKAITGLIEFLGISCKKFISTATFEKWKEEYLPSEIAGMISTSRLDSSDTIQIISENFFPGMENPAEIQPQPLTSILSMTSLTGQQTTSPKVHKSSILEIDSEETYPIDPFTAVPFDFDKTWQNFTAEMAKWKKGAGQEWDHLSVDVFLPTFLALLRKYFWCMTLANSSIQKGNDASLYEYLRLGSAFAVCLDKAPKNETDNCLTLLRGDFSGIQSFIYRITRPENDTEHVAKRLRGRSFYLSILADVIVDWILREFDLPANCILFSGGGRFDLILPIGQDQKINGIIHQIEEWMLHSFQTELGLQIAQTNISFADIKDMRRCSLELDSRLEVNKQQKWLGFMEDESFYTPGGQPWHACSSCGIMEVPEPKVCDLCLMHENLGKHLPHTKYLVYFYKKDPAGIDKEKILHFEEAPFDTRVVLITNENELEAAVKADGEKIIFKLNSSSDFISPTCASSFRFFAKSAACATKKIEEKTEVIEKENILSFEIIAQLSRGIKALGILKMDVDHLGLLMSEGLAGTSVSPHMARVATQSAMVDLFFAGHLNRICREVFEHQKKEDENSPLWNSVDGIFYIVYSGGDDLFIVGPWDSILLLAKNIQNEFHKFCGQNPEITISGGITIVKPRFPVQKFAGMVSQAESLSKENGRNKITLFNQSADWAGNNGAYSEMLDLGQEMCKDISENKLPSGFVHDLGRIYRQHQNRFQNTLNPMWTPRLYYTLARRLTPEMRKKYTKRFIDSMKENHILMAVSIASLLKREDK
jgi:CRISPR-associated protein Csm1